MKLVTGCEKKWKRKFIKKVKLNYLTHSFSSYVQNYEKLLESICIIIMEQAFLHDSLPGSGLDKPTDRDQQSWVFLNDPKNTLPLTAKPKEYFPKSKALKIPSKHYSFHKSQAYDNNRDP